MSGSYASFAAEIEQLNRALAALRPLAAAVGAAPLAGQEWFDLLRNKLAAQLDLPPLLVVAIVGGTNIGKSVDLQPPGRRSGQRCQPTGCRHETSGVPRAARPGRCGPSAAIVRAVCAPHLAIGRRSACGCAAEPVVLADRPDDSAAAVAAGRAGRRFGRGGQLAAGQGDSPGGRRAGGRADATEIQRCGRQTVLCAAVDAGKPIVVVFNQCELDADRAYWPQWLATFCEHTGARPELVYVVPYDRRAAEELRLPFYAVAAAGHATQSSGEIAEEPAGLRKANLRDDLAALHFDAIKIQTFRGALDRVLDRRDGLPAYLESIRGAASEFAAAASALSAREMARVGWPSLPAGVLVEEIRLWWNDSRQQWSRRIHGFYRVVGRGVTWPVRAAWEAVAGLPSDPIATFRQQERAAIVLAVEKLLDELQRLAQVGNDTLRPRLQRLLGGHARATLLARVESAHQNLAPVDEHYRTFLRAELDAWRRSNPRAVRFLQSLDHAAAVARPVVTVGLFFTGLHFAGDLVGQAAAQVAGTTAGHVATEAAIAGGITGGGEALVSTTSEGVRQAAGRLFGRLQARYAQQRAAWLADWLERELLGDLLADLRRGAEVVNASTFREVEAIAKSLATP